MPFTGTQGFALGVFMNQYTVLLAVVSLHPWAAQATDPIHGELVGLASDKMVGLGAAWNTVVDQIFTTVDAEVQGYILKCEIEASDYRDSLLPHWDLMEQLQRKSRYIDRMEWDVWFDNIWRHHFKKDDKKMAEFVATIVRNSGFPIDLFKVTQLSPPEIKLQQTPKHAQLKKRVHSGQYISGVLFAAVTIVAAVGFIAYRKYKTIRH